MKPKEPSSLERRLIDLAVTFKFSEKIGEPVSKVYAVMLKYLNENGFTGDSLRKMEKKAEDFIHMEANVYAYLTGHYEVKK